MKKIFALLMTVLIALSMLIFPVMSAAAVKGDVDGNGSVTAADARLTLRCSVMLENFTAEQKTLADMDNDGKITAADARKILRFSVGLFDNATITAMYARNYQGNYSSFKTIYASNDYDYSFPVILSTNADVTDFRIVGLKYRYAIASVGSSGSNVYYDANIIKNIGTFKAGEKLVVYVTCLSDLYSEYGIVYKDGDGKEKAYGFAISGYDGSLKMNEVYIADFVTYPAVIYAQFAKDYGGNYSSLETVYASDDLNFRFPVVLGTSADITDFRIVKVVSSDYINSINYYEVTTVKKYDTFTTDKRIVVYVTNKFDLYPEYGIAYKDTDGQEKFYGFLTSGRDGSLMLVEGCISSYTDAPSVKTANVTASYGNKAVHYPEENTVFASISSFALPVIVKTDSRITDFTVLGMSEDVDTAVITTNVIKNCGTLEAGESVNIYVTFNENFPVYGFSYVDTNGEKKVFSFFRSALDRSLIVEREYYVTEKTPAKISLQAAFGEQVSYDYSYMDKLVVNNSSWNYPVILATNRKINDLKLHTVEWNGTSYDILGTYNYGTLLPGETVVAYVYNHDGRPSHAISYTDENGKVRVFSFLYPVNGAGDKVYYALGNEIKVN